MKSDDNEPQAGDIITDNLLLLHWPEIMHCIASLDDAIRAWEESLTQGES